MKTIRYFLMGFIALFLSLFQGVFGQTAGVSPQFINMSCRNKVGSGTSILTVGFVVAGVSDNLSTRVMIRAVGPTMAAAPFNVANSATNPILTVYRKNGTVVANNDDWGSDTSLVLLTMMTAQQVGAFPLIIGSRDAVLILNLPPGEYTAQITGPADLGREALLEVYTVTRDTGVLRLTNMSVLSSDSPLIIGFVGDGRGPKNVLIRAIGPGLTPFGVTGVMPDPKLMVYNAQGVLLYQNDDWGSDPNNAQNFVRAGAFPLQPGSKDAAVSFVLNINGPVTVNAVGQSTTSTGAVTGQRMLVELFEVP